MAATSIRSALNDITRNYPSIEMVVRLELGDLDSEILKHQNGNIEARSKFGARQNTKYFNDKASSSDHLHEGSELRLRLPLSDEKGVPLTGHPDNKAALQASVFPPHAFHFGFAACITQLLSLRAAEWKDRNVESKTGQFGSLSGGGALATRGMPSGLGQIKASGGGRLIHPTATTRTTYSLMSLLPARRLLGRLLRR